MDRQPPTAISDEIDLYIRTYYSLLKSSGEVRVRAFEEAHSFSDSSLHAGARDVTPDVAAFAYSSARLPACMPDVLRIVLGQSHEQFEAAGIAVRSFTPVTTRGRRRPLRWDGAGTLAAFITSTSDIDDLVPIVTAYQIEWNKLHSHLMRSALLSRAQADSRETPIALAALLALPAAEVTTLLEALGADWVAVLQQVAAREADVRLWLLNGSYSQYQRSAQRWWSGIEPAYLREEHPRRPPVYFVSSNTHSLINLVGGYARAHRDRIIDFAVRENPEGLSAPLRAALDAGDEAAVDNYTYYLLRSFLHDQRQSGARERDEVQRFDAESGVRSLESPGRLDVNAQLIDLSRLRPERLDPRVQVPGLTRLRHSDAVIINIDYPLGMAAYHHLSRLGQGIGELRGAYVMGKAATLNGRVGDVMISSVVHDEHSKNTYLFQNCFCGSDVQPNLRYGTVFDNQKALTVRGPFLQNRSYMSVFYKEGYTVLEMEAGPYLSALFEIVNPRRHPRAEVVHLSGASFGGAQQRGAPSIDLGILHYASDTPYSRRQSLLSKSLSYFGVDSTYGCSIAIVRRILQREIARLDSGLDG